MRLWLCGWLLVSCPWAVAGEVQSNGAMHELLGGDHVGNGGKVIVCLNPGGAIASVELLDFYEARVSGDSLNLAAGDFHQKASAMVAQLTAFDPGRQARYAQWLARFEIDKKLLDAPLIGTEDAHPIVTPPAGCSLQQAAIQRDPALPGEKRYNISAPLWNQMDDAQRAGLIVHELVYREAIVRGYQSSEEVRYFTRLLGSGALPTWSLSDYTTLLREMNFADAVWDDPAGKTRWILLGTKGVLHEDAEPACFQMAAATIPAEVDMQSAQERLVASPLYSLLSSLEDPETWTSTRRPSDGYRLVTDWGSQTLAFVYRPQTERKSLLCLKPAIPDPKY